MVKIKEIAVLYSGGTDSTCVAFLMAKEVDKVHLLVYKRFGLFSIDNIATNVKKLTERFGEDKIVYKVIDLDKLFKEVSYAKYWHNLKNYTIQSALDRLDVIECFEVPGRKLRIGEILEKQKQLYIDLDVAPPTSL